MTLPFTVPARGALPFPVVVSSQTQSLTGTSAQSVRVRFVVEFSATTFSVACGAVRQDARSTSPSSLELVTTFPAGAQGFCMQGLGLAALLAPVRIPCAPGCNLDIDPILLELAPVTGSEARAPLDLSAPGLLPLTFVAQSAWFDAGAGTVVSSNPLGIVHN